MPAGAWPVASTMTSTSGLAIIAMASSVKRVAAMRSSVPADRAAGGAGAVGRQIGDRGDLQARRRRHLGQEHRAEFAGADQADPDRTAGGETLLQQGEQVHRAAFPVGVVVTTFSAREPLCPGLFR